MKRILLGLMLLPVLAGAWAFGCGGNDTQGSGGSGGASSAGSGGHHPTSSGAGNGGHGGGGGPPSCETEAWSTYGHDGQRTFASNGCVDGPLKAAWHYVPTPPSGRMLNFVEQAIASNDAAYLNWAASDEGYTGTTAVDKISKDGARVWTWDSGTDSNLGNWLSIAWKQVIVNDDGFTLLNDADGTVAGSNGVDWWGQTIATKDRLFMVNNEHVDGPGIFVGAFDQNRMAIWQANQFGSCRIDAGDATGGIALDGDVLFYAPSYSFGTGPAPTFSSGVYALAGADGNQKWFMATTPLSAVSAGAGAGNIYLIEAGTSGMPTLVARAEADGSVAWQVPFTSAGAQAPVLAAGLVIVAHDSTTLSAYDQATGKKKWDATVANAQTFSTPLTFGGGCHNDAVPTVQNPRTSLAAALASSTLVVTAADKIYVLNLVTGKEKWSGAPAETTAPYRDPVIVGSVVYVMDQTGLARLDAM